MRSDLTMSKTGKKITLAEGLKEAVGVVQNKKKLNEGPGAGYTVESSCTIEKVNSLSLDKIDLIKENVQYGIVYVDATFDCDIDIYVDDRKISSAIEDIKSLLVKETFDTKITYGGGWSHVTYDGTIAELSNVYSVDYTGAYHNDYDLEIIGADAKITEQGVIDFIDKDVQGDNVEEIYSVLDGVNALLDSFGTFEEAKDYAFSEEDAKRIVKETAIATFEGDVDYLGDYEIVWEADDEVEESLKLNEDNVLVSPEFIKKRDALAKYFEVEDEVKYDKGMDIFILPDGRAYFVYTGDEADAKAKEEVINAIDDLGIEAFTPDFRQDIIDNQMVDVDWFDDAMKESYEVYADDIMSEDGEHGNRLFDEMIEEGVISEEDVTEDGELVDGIDLDEKKEEFVEKLCERWDDGVEWYIDNFGEGDFSDVCKEHDLYDYDEIAETAVRWDGRGHFISMYDGEELDIGDDLFAYKYEEGWDWDKADSIHESMNESTTKGDERVKTFKLNGITYKVSKLEDSLGKGGYVAHWEDDSDNGLGYNNRGWISFDKKNYVLHNEDSKPIKDFMYVISAHDRHPKKSVADKLIATTVSMFGDDAVDTDGAEISQVNEKMGFVKKYKGYSIHDTGDDFTVTDKHGTTVGTERTISGCEGLIDELTKKETVTEDTVKLKDGKWANVGKDGKVDSGKFKTKKEADAQRRAMFANKG